MRTTPEFQPHSNVGLFCLCQRPIPNRAAQKVVFAGGGCQLSDTFKSYLTQIVLYKIALLDNFKRAMRNKREEELAALLQEAAGLLPYSSPSERVVAITSLLSELRRGEPDDEMEPGQGCGIDYEWHCIRMGNEPVRMLEKGGRLYLIRTSSPIPQRGA